MPRDTGGKLNLKKPVGSDDIRLQTIGIDLPYNFQTIDDAFTAHDDAFTAHQAESAQKHITESGENENGRYVRFDDGTQICWRSVSIPGSGWTQSPYAPFYYKNITVSLPVSFVGTAYPIYSNQESSIARRGAWVTNCAMSGSNAVDIWLAALATFDTDSMGNLLVIGRWK